MEKEADKNFYVVLIRFFDAQNVIFNSSYEPPKKVKEQKIDTIAENERMIQLYSKALDGLPTLNGGSTKKRRLNFFSSLGNQKPLLTKTERLQSELHQKQKKLNELLP